MKNFKILSYLAFTLIFLVFANSCSTKKAAEPENKTLKRTNNFLVDTLATAETIALFKNLQELAESKLLFGHQDDLAYGIGWQSTAGRSDVKEVCGDYPAVYGWDLGDIHQTNNLDGVSFTQMKGWIKEAFSRGGINTISMHLDNPVTAGNAWDNSPAVKACLPGNPNHTNYLKTLDKIAEFLKDLKTSDGIYIPVIFRPYHEHNHTWSWWGLNSCTADEYNSLWRMTVEHLRDTHNLHHLLYAISPQDITSEAEYLKRYPGDEYVDILGMDNYQLWEVSKINNLMKQCEIVTTLAENRGKIAAITEIGIDKVPISNWWTDYLLAAIKMSQQSKKIAWALVWRNDSKDHHFAPYPGHKSAPNFLKFYRDSVTVFENDLPDMYH